MKSGLRVIDGYAVQNTKHVLCALAVYEQKRRNATRAKAEQAAIDTYRSLTDRGVDGRTVRRWLGEVRNYGGAAKTPENAFGARKSCAHVKRPIRHKLRQIAAETARLSRELSKHAAIDPRVAIELAAVDRAMGDCFSRVQNNPVRCHLLSIDNLTRRLANAPVHQLHKFVSAPELEAEMGSLLIRLQGIAGQSAAKGEPR